MFKVHRTWTQIEAELAASLLASEGLHPAEVRAWPHVTFAGAELGFWVEVPADEAEAARQILQENEGAETSTARESSTPTVLRIAVVVVIVMIAAGMLLP